MRRTFGFAWALLALVCTAPMQADQSLDSLARDLSRTEGVRAVLNLQRSYAQFGMWNETGALFAPAATFTSTGS